MSAASDLALDFARCKFGPREYRGRAALQRRVNQRIGKGTSSLVPHRRPTKEQASAAEARAPKTLCHPDRSRSVSDGVVEGPAEAGGEIPSGRRPWDPTLQKTKGGRPAAMLN